jgi:hypothetical protein
VSVCEKWVQAPANHRKSQGFLLSWPEPVPIFSQTLTFPILFCLLETASVNDQHLELAYAIVIVISLLSMAGYFGWRQWQALRRLAREGEQVPLDERRYQRAQAWRRLTNCVLMVVLAGLLIASYWLGQERRAGELGAMGAQGQTEPSPEQKAFVTQYTTFWIVFGVVLLAVISLAFVDLLAIRRFARKHLRQIQADRRAMIEEEVAAIRRQRNGF